MQNELSTLTPQQQAWAGLAAQKNQLSTELQKRELSAQGLLTTADAPNVSYEVIDTNLAAYRKAFTEMQDLRKPFTGMVQERIIAPLMEFEKRVDPIKNAKYNELFNRSVDIRRQKAREAEEVNAKEQEKATFKAHIINEFSRVVGLYRQTIRQEIASIYASNLRAKIADPAPALEGLKAELSSVKPEPVTKFVAKYITKEDMQAIYNATEKPNYADYFTQLMQEMDTTFANYSSDLANAEAAIKAKEDADKLAQLEADKKAEEEKAMNTLINTAEAVQVDTPKIKKTMVVTVVESEQWAKAVMAAFILNLPNLTKWLRVKSWTKLSIGQMADYLGKLATETGEVYNNLKLEEVCK